jgi:branched-chain amino acid transport system permease protein
MIPIVFQFVVAIVMTRGAKNITRSKIRRAFVAIRVNNVSAEIIGIPIFPYELLTFAIGELYTGVA